MKSLVILLTLIAIPMAYGETATIEVPFESHGQSCYFDEIAVEYHCTWQGTPDVMTLEELETFKDVLTDEQYTEVFDDIVEQMIVEEEEPEVKLTSEERYIERLLSKDNPTEAELATVRALSNLYDVCEIGIEEGARIQTYSLWNLPDRDVNLDGAFDLKNYPKLREILKKIEECTYWNEYRAKYLVQYNDIELDDENDLSVRLGIGELTVTYEYADIPSEDNTKSGLCSVLRGPSLYDYGCLVKPAPVNGYIEYPSEILKAYNEFRSQQ